MNRDKKKEKIALPLLGTHQVPANDPSPLTRERERTTPWSFVHILLNFNNATQVSKHTKFICIFFIKCHQQKENNQPRDSVFCNKIVIKCLKMFTKTGVEIIIFMKKQNTTNDNWKNIFKRLTCENLTKYAIIFNSKVRHSIFMNSSTLLTYTHQLKD